MYVFLLFSLGAISAVAVLLVFDKKPLQKRALWMRNLNKKYIVVFLISELFTALGVITVVGCDTACSIGVIRDIDREFDAGVWNDDQPWARPVFQSDRTR